MTLPIPAYDADPAPAAWAGQALETALQQLTVSRDAFHLHFPDDTTVQGHYQPRDHAGAPPGSNIGWTTGFWTGLLWTAYELSDDPAFRRCAEDQLPSYARRLQQAVDIDHHDLGFLYMPSCVAAHRLTGDATARATALAAADVLMHRYLSGAGVIQAWGNLDNPAERGRIIIDCLLNLPLLHWASTESGDSRYAEAALSHAVRSRDHLVRADASSFHTFHFDAETGAPLRGTTAQGASDDSCWARGQAWGLYGFALNHRYAPQLDLLPTAVRMADYFVAHLPQNGVAFWDLSFGAGSAEPWDSSASAIAACGLLELATQLPPGERGSRYRAEALRLLQGLARHCAGRLPDTGALLLHGVYNKPLGWGVDEANLWGDYFYVEALARVMHGWTPHWHPTGP